MICEQLKLKFNKFKNEINKPYRVYTIKSDCITLSLYNKIIRIIMIKKRLKMND